VELANRLLAENAKACVSAAKRSTSGIKGEANIVLRMPSVGKGQHHSSASATMTVDLGHAIVESAGAAGTLHAMREDASSHARIEKMTLLFSGNTTGHPLILRENEGRLPNTTTVAAPKGKSPGLAKGGLAMIPPVPAFAPATPTNVAMPGNQNANLDQLVATYHKLDMQKVDKAADMLHDGAAVMYTSPHCVESDGDPLLYLIHKNTQMMQEPVKATWVHTYESQAGDPPGVKSKRVTKAGFQIDGQDWGRIQSVARNRVESAMNVCLVPLSPAAGDGRRSTMQFQFVPLEHGSSAVSDPYQQLDPEGTADALIKLEYSVETAGPMAK
jgi:hypothetical protein